MGAAARTVILSIRASREEIQRLRSEAASRGVSVSEMIRTALERDGVKFSSIKKEEAPA